jgi:steroid delta-isomerase
MLSAAFTLAAGACLAQSSGEPAQAQIRAALAAWTEDFNAGRADKVCALFAPDAIANVRGAAERDYQAICELLQRSLRDRSRSYRYSHAIKEILVAGDLAVVRLVWTLKVRRKGSRREATSVEPGMDIFRRQPDGSWKIVRYMAYEE